MKVCVDGRSLVGGAARGIGHYAQAVLEALRQDFPGDEFHVVTPRSRLQSRVLFGSAALTGRPRLDRLAGGCDVVWAPAPAPLAVSRGMPLVVTVQDRSWEERPGDFTPYERLWHLLARPRALVRRADRVLCTTQWGRADAIRAWGLDPARVRVTPLGVRPLPPGPPPRDSGPYLLFVGALEPRKAPDVLGEAIALARARGLRARLVVVGDGRMRSPGETVGRVDDAALAGLYAGALALVMPSHLEGFGLTALEAVAHGTPVVVSDLAPLHEVLGGAAFAYVPPGDPRALADALLAVEAASPRADPAAVAQLTWARCAALTHAALAEAAGA